MLELKAKLDSDPQWMLQPTLLGCCKRVCERFTLLSKLIPEIRKIWQDSLDSNIRSSVPACPFCRKKITVTKLSTGIVQTQVRNKFQYPAHFENIRIERSKAIRSFREFEIDEAESLLVETPLTDFENATHHPGFFGRIVSIAYPICKSMGFKERLVSQKLISPTADDKHAQFDVCMGERVFTFRLDRENHLDICMIRPSTYREYISYIRKNSSLREEFSRFFERYKDNAIAIGLFWGSWRIAALVRRSLFGTSFGICGALTQGLSNALLIFYIHRITAKIIGGKAIAASFQKIALYAGSAAIIGLLGEPLRNLGANIFESTLPSIAAKAAVDLLASLGFAFAFYKVFVKR